MPPAKSARVDDHVVPTDTDSVVLANLRQEVPGIVQQAVRDALASQLQSALNPILADTCSSLKSILCDLRSSLLDIRQIQATIASGAQAPHSAAAHAPPAPPAAPSPPKGHSGFTVGDRVSAVLPGNPPVLIQGTIAKTTPTWFFVLDDHGIQHSVVKHYVSKVSQVSQVASQSPVNHTTQPVDGLVDSLGDIE